MTLEIILSLISTKVWDWTGIELATHGSAVRLASVARHVTDCATQPEKKKHSILYSHPKQSCLRSDGLTIKFKTGNQKVIHVQSNLQNSKSSGLEVLFRII